MPASVATQNPGQSGHRILAIDPGRDKCGIAVVEITGCLLLHRIIPRHTIEGVLPDVVEEYAVTQIVLGNATTSQTLHKSIQQRMPDLAVSIIDETGSTLEARSLYWQHHPPRGWRRVVPLSLQVPPEPIDDFAAVVLAQRFFRGV